MCACLEEGGEALAQGEVWRILQRRLIHRPQRMYRNITMNSN